MGARRQPAATRAARGVRNLLWLAAALALAATTGCHAVFVRPRLASGARVIETPHFEIHTDLSPRSAALLAASAEQTLAELETMLPERGSAVAERRKVIVFREMRDFKRFLRAHLFANERAIGFYCESGEESALSWHDPPRPADLRVLRHELAHQHLARLLERDLPTWFEEGLVERLALGPMEGRPLRWDEGDSGPVRERAPSAAASIGARIERAAPWRAYVREREAADAVTAALAVREGERSWPDGPPEAVRDVPEPNWASRERGYVLHLLFIRFLETYGEGLDGAIGQTLRRAARGEPPRIDVHHRFRSIEELERRYEDFVLHEGLRALLSEPLEHADTLRRVALESLLAPRTGTASGP